MNEVKCSAPGCLNVFRSTEPLHKDVKFTCREHTTRGVANSASFQRYAHDKSLGPSAGKKPAHE